jgi:O-antigen ligase/tetratricopeptide (TPR) repeat protein
MLDYKKTQQALLTILKWLVYLTLFMPFVFVDRSIFPFIVGKLLFFQSVVQVMAVVYALLLIVNYRQFKPKSTILVRWFYFYAISLLLSAIFGADFDRAFWSNFERMTGVFVVFHFITYSIIISVVFNSWEKIKRLIQVFLAFGLIQVGVVIAQYMKPGVFLYENKGGRVWGTLGNSIYIGSYFLFHIFFALLLAFKEKKMFWQMIYIGLALAEAYIIVHSKSSRGADLALLSGAVLIVLFYGFFSKNKKMRNATIVFIAAGFLFLGGCFIFRKTELVKSIPVVGHAVNKSFSEGTGRTRMIAWDIAWKAFKERPVLGWGLENFYYAFNKYYNPESLRYSYYETWFDRSHSVIFDTLSTGGVVGTVSYFGLFAVGWFLLVGAWRKGITDKHVLLFLTLIIAVYLVQNLFVFDHPASYLYIYFTMGILLSIIADDKREAEPKYAFTPFSFFVIAAGAGVLFLIFFFSTSIKTYNAATGIIMAEGEFVQNYPMGLNHYKELMKMDTPFIDDMRAVMAKRVLQIPQGQLKKTPEYSEAVLFARQEMVKQVEARNIDVYDYLVLGQIDTAMAELDVRYLQSADTFFGRARELSPKRQQIYYTWAKNKLMEGDAKAAEEMLKDALSYDTEVPDSYWYLGMVYDSQNRREDAWEYMLKALDKRYTWKTINEIYYLIGLGETLGKYQDLVRVYEAGINMQPSAELYLGQAKVYKKLGLEMEAIGALMKAKQMDPNIIGPPETEKK